MAEKSPIRRLQRRLARPSAADLAPSDEPVACAELLAETAEVVRVGGLARRLAPSYAFIVVATLLHSFALRTEPGGPPPRGSRTDPAMPPLTIGSRDDELVSIPPLLLRKVLRWGKDNFARIRAEFRRLESKIDRPTTRLRVAIYFALDRDWQRYQEEFDLLARMFVPPGDPAWDRA